MTGQYGVWILVLVVFTAVEFSSCLRLSPVVLVPGDGGNQLEARLDKPADSTGCPTSKAWFRIWLDIWQLSTKTKLTCWADNIKLVYNKTSKISSNVAGVETRVPGWGDTSSIEYLDPSWSAYLLGDAGNYMHDMVKYLVKLGYSRGSDLRGAPYDFRFAPHSQQRYFRMLKELIEEMYWSAGQTPVTIISHSQGGLFSLHFLQQQSQHWLDQHVHRFIPLSTPWTGAVVQMVTYASGYNMNIPLIDPLIIREEQRSYETGVYLLPLPTTWQDKHQVLVQTPTANYTVQDYPHFFNDIEFPEGLDMMNNVLNLTPLTHPRVNTSCVYSLGVDTPAGLVYGAGFPDEQPEIIMGDGDGTVNTESLQDCRNFLTRAGDVVKESTGTHTTILKNKEVFAFIKSQIVIS